MGGKPRKKPTYTLSLEVSKEKYDALRWLMRKRGRTEKEYLTEAIKGLVDEDCHLIAFAERIMRGKHKPTEVQLFVLKQMVQGCEIRYDGLWHHLTNGRKVARPTMKVLEDHGYVAWNVGLDVWRITPEGKAIVKKHSK